MAKARSPSVEHRVVKPRGLASAWPGLGLEAKMGGLGLEVSDLGLGLGLEALASALSLTRPSSRPASTCLWLLSCPPADRTSLIGKRHILRNAV